MKKLTFQAPGIAQEFSRTSHELHQDALLESVKSIVLGLGASDGDYTVIYGLNAVTGAPDWEISSGAIYHAGEVFLCDGITGNSGGNVPVLTLTQTAIGQPSKLSTFITANTHFERKMVLSFAASGSANVDYADLVYLADKLAIVLAIEAKLTALKDSILGGAGGAFDTLLELQAALGNDEDFAATVTAQLALKTSLGVTTLDHTNFTAGTNWIVDSSSRLRKDNNGLVQLSLRVVNDGASTSNKTLATLPLGYRPSVTLAGVHALESSFYYTDGSGRSFMYNAQISTAGVVTLPIMDATRIPSELVIHITFFNS
jgi:hypothetical protein